jgi:integrase/recombinase XerD
MTWTDALDQFQSYLMLERSLSKHTLEAYLRDVQKLVQYLDLSGQAVEPVAVTPEMLSKFLFWTAFRISKPLSFGICKSQITRSYEFLVISSKAN